MENIKTFLEENLSKILAMLRHGRPVVTQEWVKTGSSFWEKKDRFFDEHGYRPHVLGIEVSEEEAAYARQYLDDLKARMDARLNRHKAETPYVPEHERRAKFLAKRLAKENRKAAKCSQIAHLAITPRYAGTGSTDAWVIMPNGHLMEGSLTTRNYGRIHTYTWVNPPAECLVLRWGKPDQHSQHTFEVLQMPKGNKLTSEQKKAVQGIQENIAARWEGRITGKNHNLSPSMGEGWGLCERTYNLVTEVPSVETVYSTEEKVEVVEEDNSPAKPASVSALEALANRFKK